MTKNPTTRVGQKPRRRRITRPRSVDSRAADPKLAALAASQHGLITRAQAIAAGMSPTSVKARVRSGRWERVSRGVYAFAGTPLTKEREILAACLAAGPDAVATSYTAAALYRLHDIYRGGKPIIAVAPRNKTRCPERKARAVAKALGTKLESWAFTIRHRKYLARRDARAVMNNIPVTSVAWTYVELAATVPEKVLHVSILEAIRREMMTAEELAAAVVAAGTRTYLGKLRRILASPAMRSAYRSQSEIVLEQQLRAEGYSDVLMNHEVRHAGIRIGEADACSRKARLIVEVDGPGHELEAQQSIDRIRTACYGALAYAVARLKPEQVASRHQVRKAIAAAEARRRQRPVTKAEFLALWQHLTAGLPPTHVPSQEELPTVYARYTSNAAALL